MADQKIKFSVEGSQSIHSEFDKIIKESQSLAGIWEDYQSKVTESIKQQIDLLHQRNDAASQLFGSSQGGNDVFQSNKNRGAVDPVSLLQKLDKNVADFFESIEEDGLKLSSETLNSLKDAIKSIQGPSIIGDEDNKEGKQKGKSGRSSFGERFALNTMLSGLTTNDPLDTLLNLGISTGNAMLGNLVSALPGALGIVELTMLQQKYNALKNTMPGAIQLAKTSGVSLSGIFDGETLNDPSYSKKYGLKRGETYGWFSDILKASAGQGIDESGFRNILGLSQSYDISRENLLALQRTGRGQTVSVGGRQREYQAGDTVLQLMDALKTHGGYSDREIFTTIDDHLSTLVQLSQKQVELGVEVTQRSNLASIASLSSIIKNPDELRAALPGIEGGLANPVNDQAEALVNATLRELNPGISSWELQKMRKNPLAQTGLLEGVLGKIMDFSGGNETSAKHALYSFFGGSVGEGTIDKLIEAAQSNDFSSLSSIVRADAQLGKGAYDNLQEKLPGTVNPVNIAEATLEVQKLNGSYDTLISTLETTTEVVEDMMKGLDKFNTAVVGTVKMFNAITGDEEVMNTFRQGPSLTGGGAWADALIFSLAYGRASTKINSQD